MIDPLQNAAWNTVQNLKRKRKAAETAATSRADRPKNARDRDRADPNAENRTADVRAARGIDYTV